jgi:hypothetical protein
MWRGERGNIPNHPNIIVTPVNLHIQMDLELQRFLLPNFFEIMPYIAGHTTRTKYWQNVWTMSKNAAGNRILLATCSVSDSTVF